MLVKIQAFKAHLLAVALLLFGCNAVQAYTKKDLEAFQEKMQQLSYVTLPVGMYLDVAASSDWQKSTEYTYLGMIVPALGGLTGLALENYASCFENIPHLVLRMYMYAFLKAQLSKKRNEYLESMLYFLIIYLIYNVCDAKIKELFPAPDEVVKRRCMRVLSRACVYFGEKFFVNTSNNPISLTNPLAHALNEVIAHAIMVNAEKDTEEEKASQQLVK